MTRSDLDAVIERALEAVPFQPPVDVAYCERVKERLDAELPEALVDVYFRRSAAGATTLIVGARQGEHESRLEIPAD